MHAFYFVTNVIVYKALLVYEKGGKLVHKSFIPVIAKGILNGTAISTFTVLVLPVLFVNLDLSLNDSKSDMPSSTGASLQYWHKLCDVFE